MFTTIPSHPDVGRQLGKDLASLEGAPVNQCLTLIPASTYPLSSVDVGLVHTFLTQALTLFYDLAFSIGQMVDLDPELDPDIHQELGTGFDMGTVLSSTLSNTIK